MPKKTDAPLDETPTKQKPERTTYWMDFDLKRAYEEAAVEAKKKGDKDFPSSLKDFLDQAARHELNRLRQQRKAQKK